MTIYEMLLMAILGHFIGDYLFQTKTMALRKSDKGLDGLLYCVWHCVFYAGSVTVMMGLGKTFDLWIFVMAFLSHYPIDRWGLGQKWLDAIGGRDFMNDWEGAVIYTKQHQSVKTHHVYDGDKIPVIVTSFGCIVYTIVDNTLHIVLMWVGICLLRNYGLV